MILFPRHFLTLKQSRRAWNRGQGMWSCIYTHVPAALRFLLADLAAHWSSSLRPSLLGTGAVPEKCPAQQAACWPPMRLWQCAVHAYVAHEA